MIASLIRSTTSDLELQGRWAETLVLPLSHEGAVDVYTRTTNGAKGRGNAWPATYATVEDVFPAISGNRVVGYVQAEVSSAERTQLLADGWSGPLATRITHKPLQPSEQDAETLLGELVAETFLEILTRSAEVKAKIEEETAPEPEVEVEAPQSPPSPFEPLTDEAVLALHAVSVSVPSGPAVEGYVGRDIVDSDSHGMTDFEVFDLAAEMYLNVLLVGDTGSGKTTAVRAWARHHDRPCYVVPGNGPLDPPSLFGRFIPNELTGTFVWIDGPVTTLLRHGGVLVLDEINMVSAKVLSVLYPLLDGRREIPLLDHSGEVVHAHQNLQVFATMNEGIGYSGTAPLSHAVKNRFLILRWGYDQKVEESLITSRSVRLYGDRIREQYRAGDVETPTTTNSLMVFERLAKKTRSLDLAIEVFLNRYNEGSERDAVKVMFDGVRANIEDDLGLTVKKEPNVNPAFRRTGEVPDSDDYVITIA